MAERHASAAIDAGTRRWALLTAAACLLPLLLQLPLMIALGLGATALVVSALSARGPLPSTLRLLLAVAAVAVVVFATGMRFGRDTGCALLAAMIAIKPAETFSLRDARSLVGFGLFAPFATFLLDQGPTTLVLGLLATLMALATLQRLADVESGLTASAGMSWASLLGIGKLLGLGLPVAMAVFWLFPRLASPMWGVPDRAIARPGLSDSMSPNDWVDLLGDETVTLRARFFGPPPRQSQMYWRGPVLWDFDGVTWTQPRELRALPPPHIEFAAAPRWDYELAVEPTDRRQLVALDAPLAAPAGVRLSGDAVLTSASPLSALTQWRMQSAPVLRNQTELPPYLRARALALPSGFNPRTVALGAQWRQAAGGDDAAIVRRALAWIGAEFTYTLDNPRNGRDSIDGFLFVNKAGFCEHFSSSFVVLMRAAGIPARVVIGYAGGYRNPIGDYWLVRRSDAHAWAEVWMPDRGWVRVDPTAAVAPERIYDTLADRAPGAEGLLGAIGATPMMNIGDWMRRGWNDFVLGFDAQRQERLLSPFGVDKLGARQLGLLFAFASVGGLALMLWLSLRAPREADPVLRAWHALGIRYARLGLGREPFEPATAWAERVSKERPDLGAALASLTHRFSDWRYAPAQHARGGARALVQALRAHRPASRPR